MLPSYAEALSCHSVGKRREIVGTNWFSNKVYLRRSPVAFLVYNDGAEISASISSTLTKQLFKWKNDLCKKQTNSPAVKLCGATSWWGSGRISTATGRDHHLQSQMWPAAGQPPVPSGHTEPAGTRPQTRCGAPCRTLGEAAFNSRSRTLPEQWVWLGCDLLPKRHCTTWENIYYMNTYLTGYNFFLKKMNNSIANTISYIKPTVCRI